MQHLGSFGVAFGFSVIFVGASAAPIDWVVQVKVFDLVCKPHAGCTASPRTVSEMDCNNYRARALKRFQTEWVADACWKGGKVVPNPAADKRVNSELPR